MADTFIIIRDTVMTVTDISTEHSLSLRVATQTLGFTSLPREPESRSDWAFKAGRRVWNFFQAKLTITSEENANSFQTSSFLDSPPTRCRWGFLLCGASTAKTTLNGSSSREWAVRPILSLASNRTTPTPRFRLRRIRWGPIRWKMGFRQFWRDRYLQVSLYGR